MNLFYLKDILIKDTATQEEKIDALCKIKRNIQKSVFGLAMKSLLSEFDKVQDAFIQKELLQAIGCSAQSQLLGQLKALLERDNIDAGVKEDIEDTVQTLSVVAMRPQSFVVNYNQQGKAKGAKEKSRNVNSFKMKGMASLAAAHGPKQADSDCVSS